MLGTARKVVPISEDQRRKSKLNTTSEGGYNLLKRQFLLGAARKVIPLKCDGHTDLLTNYSWGEFFCFPTFWVQPQSDFELYGMKQF